MVYQQGKKPSPEQSSSKKQSEVPSGSMEQSFRPHGKNKDAKGKGKAPANPQSSGQNKQNQEAQREVQKEQEDPQMPEKVIQFEKRLEDTYKEYERLNSELEQLEKRVISTDIYGDDTLLDVLTQTSIIQKFFIEYEKKINRKKASYKESKDRLDKNLESINQLKFNNEEFKKEADELISKNSSANQDLSEKITNLMNQMRENKIKIKSKEEETKTDSKELDQLLEQEKKFSQNIPNIETYVWTVNQELNDQIKAELQKEPWSSDQSPDSNYQSDLDELGELLNSDSDEDISFNEQEPSVSTTTPALEINLPISEVPTKQSENKKDSELGEQEEEFRMVPPRRKPRGYSGKNSENTVPVVSLDGKHKATFVKDLDIGNTTFARQKSRSIQLVKVLLPKGLKLEQKTALFEEPFFTFKGTKYRFDLFSSKEPDVAWAIEADKGVFSDKIHPFDEAVAYTRQAFLTQPIAGLEGSINGATVKVNTPFVLSNTQPPIQLLVGDGWGFIKASQVEKKIKKINHKPSKPRLEQPAQPNTQMLQWLPEDQGLIFELVESGKKQLEKTLPKEQSQPSNQEQSEENVNVEALYRGVTTGSFPVKVGTAMPVPGEEVVLSGGFLPNGTNVALHRSPADKLNWSTGRVADAQSALSKFMATMTVLQYRWSGYQSIQSDHPFVFFKGLLGVIPDQNWPSEYSDVSIVVCSEDRKVDSSWEKSEDVERAKESEVKFSMRGNLAISKIITPGGTIGVPPGMMKKLSGDYDGDEVHLLAEQDSPVLFNLIASQEHQENDKLKKDRQFPDKKPVPEKQSEHEKVLASNPFAVLDEDTREVSTVVEAARSLGTRLQEIQIGDNLVGIWSTIADLLKTVHPFRLRGGLDQDPETSLANEIGLEIIQSPLTEAELWQYVGQGIKAGTDLAKTNLKNATFAGRKLTPEQLLNEGRKLLKFLVKEKRLTNPHKRRNKEKIAKDIREHKRMSALKVRKGHYGNLSGIMHGLDLHLEMTRTSKNFAPKGELAKNREQEAKEYLKKASSQPITNVNEAIIKIYGLLGKLKQVVSRARNNENAKENGETWMLFVLDNLDPANWRDRLYEKFSKKEENNPSDLKQEYDTMVKEIEKLWQRWIKMFPKNVR